MQKYYSRILTTFSIYTIILSFSSLITFSCDDREEVRDKTLKVEDVLTEQDVFLSGILVGYNFDEGTADVFMDNINESSTLRTKIDILEKEFEILPIQKKYCIGSYDLESMEGTSCPSQSFISNKLQNCGKCYEKTGFNPAFYKVDRLTLSPQQQQYNLKSHYVYLAYFNTELPKVGIAYKPRLLGRWLEQGALVATILKECNSAYEARELEEKVSKTFKLPEGYSSVEKYTFLRQPFSLDVAYSILKEYKSKIISHFQLGTVEYEIADLRTNYYKSPINFNELQYESQEIGSLKGRCVGMIGDKIVYQNNTILKIQFLKKYIGKSLIKIRIR